MSARRSPARLATYIVGGVLLGGSILGAGLGGVAALAQPDYGRMPVSIPDGVTSIEIDTAFSNIEVGPGSDGQGRSYAVAWASGSNLFGTMPTVHVEVEGTKAIVSLADEDASNEWGVGMATLSVVLSDRTRLDSLTVLGGGYDQISVADVDRIAIDGGSHTNLSLENPGPSSQVTLTGSGQFYVSTLSQDQWRVVKPGWFDAFAAQYASQYTGGQSCITGSNGLQVCSAAQDVCAAGVGWAPAICITPVDTAPRTIDFSGVAKDTWVEIHDE